MLLSNARYAPFIGSMLLLGLFFYAGFINVQVSKETIVSCGLIQIAIFLYGYYSLGKLGGSFFSAYLVFMVIFYLFQNGQIILYVLGLPFDTYYIEKYDYRSLLDVIIFSTLCLIMAFVAGIFSIQNRSGRNFITRINDFQDTAVLGVAKRGCIITSIIAVPIMFAKFYVCATSGYFAEMAFAETIPSFIKAVEKIFLGFCILILVYAKPNTSSKRMTLCLLMIWSLLAVFSGDRTVGLAGITTVAFLNFQRSDSEKIGRNIIKLLCAGIFVVYLINIAFSFRMQETAEVNSFSSTVIDAISQLGFSFFPLSLTMDVCPSMHDYVYGKSLVGGLVSGLIPNNFDPIGILDVFFDWSNEPSRWIESDFNYTFGIDFSLTAECYANFGWWGWIAMFFLCSIIAKLLRTVDYRRRDNLFDQYTSLVLLYSWFTLPRRKSYYIYNNWFWYVLAMSLIIYFTTKKRSQIK